MGSLDLSVIVPIFNEEEGILIFTHELRKNLETLNLSYEVLYINDGSSDATQVKIESIDWANLKHYEFQTNLGHMRALEAGMDLALGEMILTIDADLQHPPKYISEFIKTKNSGQISVFTINIGNLRGEHYHHTKSEKFLIIQGKVKVHFRNIATNQKHSVYINSKDNKIFNTIPGWVHTIKNVGNNRVVGIVWANEFFNIKRPDTISVKI